MTTLKRRELLQLLGSTGAAIVLPVALGCSSDRQPDPIDAAVDSPVTDATDVPVDVDTGPREGFIHGVASGDPTSSSVILWTRITPPSPSPPSIDVTWEISSSRDFATISRTGTFNTNADRDYTVKVDLTGLDAGATLFYRFRALNFTSPVGRTKTAGTGAVARARFAVVSCSNYAFGYFHVYQNLARREDLDAVLHLGDYIYEYANNQYGNTRPLDPPTEIFSLDDYRRRYRHNRKDPDLQAVHAMHPFIVVWDDHEFANDAWREGAQNHNPMTEGSWMERRRAATRAYMEWMPIREQADGRIFRKLQWGDLLDLMMIDTRMWGRDLQARDMMGTLEMKRQLLGADQERWLIEQITTSRARWKLVGQQVMIGQVNVILNTDAWDGYVSARNRVLAALRGMMVPNVVMLTGDIHSSWAMDLTEDPFTAARYDGATGRGSLAVEFVCPAVTSPGIPDFLRPQLDMLLNNSPHIKYVDGSRRGYLLLDVTPDRAQGQWFYVANVAARDGGAESAGPAFATSNGANHLTRVMNP